MLVSAQGRMLKGRRMMSGYYNSRMWARAAGLFFLCCIVTLEFSPFFSLSASAQQSHIQKASDTCSQAYFSSDGNPYALCPGPYPTGGNCVWWAWEQWHSLNYNLPPTWGNAADWAVDAQASGLTLGTTPRVGSIAVFPVDDGYWAAGPAGHVAFVTSVSGDGSTFDVTYQNYGDAQYMYTGTNYSVSLINEPQFQNGQLRFIYFPQAIDEKLFAQLPGIDGVADPTAAVQQANNALNTPTTSTANVGTDTSASVTQQPQTTYTSDRIALGLSPASSDQEYNADFTGTGTNSLLLYNRQQGKLQIYRLNQQRVMAQKVRPHISADGSLNDNLFQVPAADSPIVNLGDSITPDGTWGSSLDIYIGNFSGGKASEILLYDRVAGTIQLISLTSDFHIKKHVTIPDIGTDWELAVGRFNGKSSGVFMYKRYAITTSNVSDSPLPSDTNNQSGPTNSVATQPAVTNKLPTSSSTPQATSTVKAVPTPTPTSTATPVATVTPTPTSTVVATPDPTPTVTATPVVTATPTATVVPSATPTAVPTVVATPTTPPVTAPTAVPPAVVTTPTAANTVKATSTNSLATQNVSYDVPSASTLNSRLNP